MVRLVRASLDDLLAGFRGAGPYPKLVVLAYLDWR